MCNWIYEETPNDDDILDNSVIVTMFCGLISYTDNTHFEYI